MAGTVLVSGGSGYIAGFLIRQLLDAGWTVHTTVRSLAREAELRPQLGGDADRLKFFAADLGNDAGWAEATAGCSHVAHVASPFPATTPKDENDLIVPAREGALRALRAAKGAGVTRFVLTSSVAAVAYGQPGKNHFTEADWTNVDGPGVYPYVKSKTIAERAARDWVAAEGGDMEFVSVNPSAVLGPVVSDDLSASIEVVRQLLAGALPGCPDFGFGIVDVRDVADMHVRALTQEGIAGERFICAGRFMKMIEVARVLKDGLGQEARKVPLRGLPNWLVRVSALFNPQVKAVVGELGNVRDASSAHGQAVLGWMPRPEEETILDCARSLIAQGIVKV
jgi:dihydroflavonol-4-reductase